MHPHSFAPSKRLHYPWEYRLFFKNSQAIKLSECVIYRIQNDRGHFRVGITIKAKGNSVNRNRVKRLIREYFRTHSEILGSYDYNVVVPSQKKLNYLYAQALRHCLQQRFPDAVTRH